MIRVLTTVVILFILARSAEARVYKIEVDYERSGQSNIANTLPNNGTLSNAAPWGSSGTDTGNFRNRTSQTIYGMHLVCVDPAHTFASDCTGGQLFSEVWRKTDGSELIFRAASVGVVPGKRFYMKVPKTDDLPVRNIFRGRVFGQPGTPAAPTGTDWELIWTAPALEEPESCNACGTHRNPSLRECRVRCCGRQRCHVRRLRCCR